MYIIPIIVVMFLLLAASCLLYATLRPAPGGEIQITIRAKDAADQLEGIVRLLSIKGMAGTNMRIIIDDNDADEQTDDIIERLCNDYSYIVRVKEPV